METTSISRKPAVKPGWGRWQSWQSEEADSRETLRMRGVRRGSHRIQKKKETPTLQVTEKLATSKPGCC